MEEQIGRIQGIDEISPDYSNTQIEALQTFCVALDQLAAHIEANLQSRILTLQAFETLILKPETRLIASYLDSRDSLRYTTLGGAFSQNIPMGSIPVDKIVPNLQISASLEWLRWKSQGQTSDHALWSLSAAYQDRAPLHGKKDVMKGIHRWQMTLGVSLSGVSKANNSETLTLFTRYRPRIDDFASSPYDIDGYVSFQHGRGPIVGMQVSTFLCW